ncbi:MAG TPA: Gfo/Idh/MocA family oxidoreductase [Actinokineospora sp.]|nr:Gfo/Idh/MocA family oxidoreductase [Actinokineospora sp.]
MAFAGAGARGSAYADLAAQRPDRAQVVAVAEPRTAQRAEFALRHGLARDQVFTDWRDLAAWPRLADVVVIALLDQHHLEAALAFIERGYDVLLEKPMATSIDDCERIAAAATAAGVTAAICHVMRYTDYTKAIKAEIATGAIGDIVSVEHLEPVGYYHFAHSFVRGNWRREDETSFVLLTKSCHDIDWLGHIVDRRPVKVSSFGELTHFRAENRPDGAADRCLDCSVEDTCPYSAVRLYRDGLRNGGTKGYFTRVMTDVLTEDAVTEALREGPYGRCVYACDNDVADHQVVSVGYEGGVTASFTLAAFTPLENRHTRIFGTHGQITGNGRHIEVYDFRTERTTVIDTSADGSSAAEGHGGGDAGLITAFVDALYEDRPDLILSGMSASLDSHRVVFAAEVARRDGVVVHLPPNV